MKKLSFIALFLSLGIGCGLLNSDKEKLEIESVYEWEELLHFKGEWITAVAAKGENEIYVAQSNRLSYSKDGGKVFERLNIPDSADVTQIKIFDRLYIIGEVYNSDVGYWGTKQGYIYASDDNGESWEEITGGFVMQDFTILENRLHIGRNHGVNTFDLEGDSLLYANSFIHSKLSDHMETITAAKDGTIYLGSHAGVYASYDDGENWIKVSTTISKDHDHVRSIVVDNETDVIYASSDDRLYYRNKDEIVWEKKSIDYGTESVRLLSKNRIIISHSRQVSMADRNEMVFEGIGPVFDNIDDNPPNFAFMEVFSEDKILVASKDYIYIGNPVEN